MGMSLPVLGFLVVVEICDDIARCFRGFVGGYWSCDLILPGKLVRWNTRRLDFCRCHEDSIVLFLLSRAVDEVCIKIVHDEV